MLAESNAAQVAKIIRILRELSLEPATPDDARAMLALKGAAATKLARLAGLRVGELRDQHLARV